MNYRHAYHAGNFADVLKHAALVAVLEHLRKKETPFAAIDSHAGRGAYDLGAEEAAKTGEAKNGVLKLMDVDGLPALVGNYLKQVREYLPAHYPGSPLIAAAMLRDKDRLVAIEKHPEEYAALARTLEPFRRAQVIKGDGYAELAKFVPPRERRGLVLIDPPFEATDEFKQATAALIGAYRNFNSGIFLLWYPVKARGEATRASGELLNAGIARLLRIELDVGGARDAGENALSATGLFVVNAPYGFCAAMEDAAGFLARTLARGSGARARVERLAGEE